MKRSPMAFAAHLLAGIARGKTGSSAVLQTIVSRFFVLGVNLLNGVICARNLGPAGRGEQAAMLLWPQLICFVLTLGVPFAVVYEARRNEANRDGLYSTALVLSFGLGLVATIVGIVFIPHWLHAYDARAVRFAQWLMIFGPQIMITMTVGSIFESKFEFTVANLLRYGPPTLTLLALCGLLIAHTFTPFLTALAYSFPTLVITVTVIPKLLQQFKFSLASFSASSKQLLHYGVRMYGSDVLSTFGTQIDQVLVVGLLSPSNLGTYTVALSVSRVLNVFQTSVRVVLLPKAAGLEKDEVVSLVARVARISTALTLLGAIALLTVLPFVLPRLYGHDFIGAIVVSQILTFECVISSMTGVLTQAFNATNKPGVATLLQGLGLMVAVPVMLVLIPRLGLIGAAIALLASTLARIALALICFPMLLKVAIPPLILKKADISFLRAALAQRRTAVAS